MVARMEAKDITIHQHAIEQFRERTGTKRTDVYITNRIRKWFSKAEPTNFKKNSGAVCAIIRHDYEWADYYRYNEWIIVVTTDKKTRAKTIKTLYVDAHGRFV